MKSMKVSAFFRANFFYNRTVLNTFYNSKFYSISCYYKVTFKKWKYIVETLNVDFPFLIIKQKKIATLIQPLIIFYKISL